jgi:hypothetical protein
MALLRPPRPILPLCVLAFACSEDIPQSSAFAYQTKAERLDADATGDLTTADTAETTPLDAPTEADAPAETDTPAADLPPACTPGTCDDANVCTQDTCTNGTCGHTPKSGPCEDGEPCTEPDLCADGKCAWGPPKDCNDFNACTDDTCKVGTGCVSAPKASGCSDGNPCTVEACFPETGCKYTAMPDGETCKAYGDCTIGYCLATKCEVQDVLWTKVFGNAAGADEARAVQSVVTDWVVAGAVAAPNGTKAAAWKLNMAGNQGWGWESSAEGSGRFDDAVYDSPWMVLVGAQQLPDKIQTGFFAKINGQTGTVGVVTPVGAAEKAASLRAVAVVAGNQYVAVGKTMTSKAGSADVWVALLDGGGKLTKQVTWGTATSDDAGVAVAPLKKGFVVGATLDQGNAEAPTPGQDIEVVRFDLQGGKQWSVGPGLEGVQFDPFVAATGDDGVVVAATSGSGTEANPFAVKLVRLDAAGKILWGNEVAAKGGSRQATAVRLASDGSPRVVGWEEVNGEVDGWMAAFTDKGGLTWSQTLGLPGQDRLFALDPSATGRFAVAGQGAGKTSLDVLVRRADLWGVATCAASGACASKGFLECDDKNPCTADLCQSGACKNEPLPAGQPCGGGSACDGKGACKPLG